MTSSYLQSFANIVKTYQYDEYYKSQSLPVSGAIVSIPTALMSGAGAIYHIFQATSSAWKGEESSKFFWAAKDLTVIFTNSVLNIVSVGLLNFYLMKNGLGELLNHKDNPPPEDQLPRSTSVTFSFKDQKLTFTDVVLPQGTHDIQLLHGTKEKKKITISHPVFIGKSTIDGALTKCLVMNESDFRLIQATIHGGAFGGDYQTIGNLIVVWKLPADLLYISGYYDNDLSPSAVGTYGMMDDNWGEDLALEKLKNQAATKNRIDSKIPGTCSGTSIHYLATENHPPYHIPVISTGNFFADFYNPTDPEMEKIRGMIGTLKGLGIDAFLCNRAHHLIVFYTKQNEEGSGYQLLTPKVFAGLLNTNPAILETIKAAALPDKNMDEWKEIFISVFGK